MKVDLWMYESCTNRGFGSSPTTVFLPSPRFRNEFHKYKDVFGVGIQGDYNISNWTTETKDMNECKLFALNNCMSERPIWW